MVKNSGHVIGGDTGFDNSSRIEPKRAHQWFDGSEPEMFPNKKQAVQVPVGKSSAGISNANIPSWENASGFNSAPNQFIHRLFGSETARSVNFGEKNTSPVGRDNARQKSIQEEDASAALSIYDAMEDPENCFPYDGIRKVKVNQVKDNDSEHASKEYNFNSENTGEVTADQAYCRENESNFISMGQLYNKEGNGVTVTGHSYSSGEDANIISFGNFHDEHSISPVAAQPLSTYESSYIQHSTQTSETACEKELEASCANPIATVSRIAKPRQEFHSKSKQEIKTSKKEAPNSFPSNVRSLISTGMLDGVPVKYVSLSREELRGIIKGSGYLCGCQLCNFSKVLNAYEFERHAGCKTKHPNNHIYFENGKTIYQIVQELRSTPESMLFDVIQTVFGAPINQKSFRIWKESFQAATRELQRIYGKEELNL